MLKYFLKKYRVQNFIILFATFIICLIQIISAVIHTFSTDALIKGNVRLFIVWNMISLSLWGILFVLNYYTSAYEEKIVQNISIDIREYITQKIINTDYQNVTQYQDGTYTSWLNNDLQQIQDNGLHQYYEFWSNIFSVFLSVIALINYHYSLVLLTFLLMGVMMKFPSLFEKKMNTATHNLSKENELFISRVQDTIAGYDILFSFNNLPYLKDRLKQASVMLKKEKINYVKAMKFSEGFISIINIFSQVSIITFTGILAYFNFVTIGALSTTGNLSSTIFNSLAQSNQNKLMFNTIETLFEKYNHFEKENNYSEPKTINVTNKIELKNITYSINNNTIIQNINYVFEKGKKYAIIGESGSGKSTLLNILSGKITDFQGQIIVDGHSLVRNETLQNVVAYIPQSSYIFNDSVQNNINLWRDIQQEKIQNIYQLLNIDTFMSLHSIVKESGKNLSGGQKQRIAFARALVGNESIYLLDESTANLDKETAIMLENILLNDPEATVIMVTHHLFDENKHKFDKIIQF